MNKACGISSELSCPFLYQNRTPRPWKLASLGCRQRMNYRQFTQRNVYQPSGLESFKSSKGTRPSIAEHRQVQSSTITSQERRVFEKIRQRFGGQVDHIIQPPITGVHDGTVEARNEPDDKSTQSLELPLHNLNIDNILSLFAPAPRHESFARADDATEDGECVGSTLESRRIAHEALRDLQHSFLTALRATSMSPDRALWQVLEAEVFPLVQLLSPAEYTQSSISDANLYDLGLEDALATNSIKIPPSLERADPRTPVLPLMTILYPAATLLAMRLYAAYGPASPYAMALLPQIRALGPTSYILAGSTYLYKVLIQLKWEVYTDVSGIVKLVNTMLKDGVELDETTIDVLQRIFNILDSRHGREWLSREYHRIAAGELRGLNKYLIQKQGKKTQYESSEVRLEVD